MQHYKTIIPHKNLQGMTNNVGLTFSVGDTAPRFTTHIWEIQLEMVTLSEFSVVIDELVELTIWSTRLQENDWPF